ncbi:hypothetical protein DERF_002888 [Dermatophagoides farinae]|uniref:Uncharacterized protein n=1 Tax=Dermatophagoides farinae TaxID=6954 RepID=A0A922IE13_DERFA|nr:hypothetical protein DERF_002888 [Dermatophagoides farinae]
MQADAIDFVFPIHNTHHGYIKLSTIPIVIDDWNMHPILSVDVCFVTQIFLLNISKFHDNKRNRLT